MKKILIVLACVLCASFVIAQETSTARKISVDEAVKLAIENNLSLQSQAVTTSTKKRKSDYYWNQFIPSVGVNGGITADNNGNTKSYSPPVEMSSLHLSWQVQAQLQLSLALLDGIKSYRLDYQNGLITYDKAKLQLERDIRKAYYGILLTTDQLELLQSSYANAQAQEESAAASFRAGRSPEITWLQAQVTTKNMEPNIDTTKNALNIQKSQLAMYMGLPLDTDFELEPVKIDNNYVTLNKDDLVKKATDKKPDILEMKAQLLTLNAQRGAQKFQAWTPALSLSWNSQNVFTQITAPSFMENSISTSDDWNKSGGFTIGISWTASNLLPFSTSSQSIKDIDDNIQKLNIGLAQSVQGAELEIYSKVNELEQIRLSTVAQTATVELAERSYRDTLTAYRNGSQNLLQVQTANEQLSNARFNNTKNYYQYLQGLVDLEYSIGVPFGTLNAKK